MSYDIHQDVIRSADGTEITYQRIGDGAKTPIVIANGPGADYTAWRGIFDEFADAHPIITWDYRGLFRSEHPHGANAYAVRRHAEDLNAILEKEQIQEAIFIGWSLGTQILLEAYRMFPERFRGLVSVNGTFGQPFEASPLVEGTSRLGLVGGLFGFGRALTTKLIDAFGSSTRQMAIARRLRLVGPTVNPESFAEVVSVFTKQPPQIYHRTISAFGHHDAADVLPRLECPTLFIAGRRDPLVPSNFSTYMAARAQRSELLIIPIASHHLPIEFPEFLNLRFDAFFDKIEASHAN